MAITLHSVSTRHLRGALALASVVGVAAALLLRRRLDYELLVAAAWDAAVLIFIALGVVGLGIIFATLC